MLLPIHQPDSTMYDPDALLERVETTGQGIYTSISVLSVLFHRIRKTEMQMQPLQEI